LVGLLGLIVSEASAIQIFGTVDKVCDGDTVVIRVSGRPPLELDLFGIDAPELDQSYGEESKELLEKLLSDKLLRVETVGDINREVKGWLILNTSGQNVNQQMVRAGYAWHDPKESNDVDLHNGEETARWHKYGLWIETSPTPPWEWRQQKNAPSLAARQIPPVSPIMRIMPSMTQEQLNDPRVSESFRNFYLEQSMAKKAQDQILQKANIENQKLHAEEAAADFLSKAGKLTIKELHEFIANHPEITLSKSYQGIERYIAFRERVEQTRK
jgi:endonuclease YncB( thermonuclease family)